MGAVAGQPKPPIRWRQFIPGNEVRLVRGGAPYFQAMEEMIREAKYALVLHTYIFANDQTGHKIHKALLEAAIRGVKVQILLDAYGSQELRKDKEWLQQWDDAGVRYRFFGRYFTGESINLGRRLHHKVLITDHRTALVGGLNVADRYNDMPDVQAWLDFALQVRGPIALHLAERIHTFWRREPIHPTQLHELRSVFKPVGNVPVRIIQNDYFRGVREISNVYQRVIRDARKRVLIIGAYFLPGRKLRKSLEIAIRNGAEVKVVLGHHSDIFLAQYASRYLYRWLLRNRIQIFEWAPTVLHAKIAVVDDRWSTVGSYNINYLSAYESIELNLEVWHEETTAEIANTINQIIAEECEPINAERFRQTRTLTNLVKEWVAYRLFRFMIRILLIFGGGKKPYTQNQ